LYIDNNHITLNNNTKVDNNPEDDDSNNKNSFQALVEIRNNKRRVFIALPKIREKADAKRINLQ
jgi:hypothetical protein